MELLTAAGDLRALMIVRGKLRPPREIRQVDQRKREIQHHRPDPEVPKRRRVSRHEEHVDRQHQKRRPEHDPRLAAAPAALRPVAQNTDQGIRDDVRETGKEDDRGHGIQADTELGIVWLHVDANRQQRHRDRHVHRRVADDLGSRNRACRLRGDHVANAKPHSVANVTARRTRSDPGRNKPVDPRGRNIAAHAHPAPSSALH